MSAEYTFPARKELQGQSTGKKTWRWSTGWLFVGYELAEMLLQPGYLFYDHHSCWISGWVIAVARVWFLLQRDTCMVRVRCRRSRRIWAVRLLHLWEQWSRPQDTFIFNYNCFAGGGWIFSLAEKSTITRATMPLTFDSQMLAAFKMYFFLSSLSTITLIAVLICVYNPNTIHYSDWDLGSRFVFPGDTWRIALPADSRKMLNCFW